jgi:hypothetical protein
VTTCTTSSTWLGTTLRSYRKPARLEPPDSRRWPRSSARRSVDGSGESSLVAGNLPISRDRLADVVRTPGTGRSPRRLPGQAATPRGVPAPAATSSNSETCSDRGCSAHRQGLATRLSCPVDPTFEHRCRADDQPGDSSGSHRANTLAAAQTLPDRVSAGQHPFRLRPDSPRLRLPRFDGQR